MRITGFLVLLSLLFGTAIVNAQDESRSAALLREADSLISKSLLPEALAKTKEVLAIVPESHAALQKQINILFLMNDEKESVRLVDDAIKKYPNEAGYHYLRGIINNARNKFSRALDDFTQAIDLGARDILYRCYLGRGVSYFNLLEYENALADLTSSIEQNDTVASAFYSRGMVNYELQDYTAAAADFQKVLTLSAGNATLYFNLGMSYYRLNEKTKACPNFNKSCSLGNINACKMSMMECAKALPAVP